MKIAFFLGGMGRGGAERVISILSRDYAERGWETDIVVLLDTTVSYELHETTRLIDLTGGGGSRVKRVPYWLREIRRYAKQKKPDVIVSFVARINALVQLATTGLSIPTVVSERCDPAYDGRELPVRFLNRIYYPKAKRVVVQTKRIKATLSRRVQANTEIVLNPISVTTEARRPAKKRIVTVGRVMPQKNHRLLIEGFAEVLKDHPEYELWIYGEGDLLPELEYLVKTLGLEKKIFFAGNHAKIHEQIADAEFFVLSSNYEGLSNALMEAMMMGLPCISTGCAGSDEILRDGENGLLVPVGNQEKLTEAMLWMIEHPKEAEKLGEAAKEDAKRFRAEQVLLDWHRVIEG